MPALAFEIPAPCQGGMIMQLNKVHPVKTIDRVAAELGETIARIFDLAATRGLRKKSRDLWIATRQAL